MLPQARMSHQINGRVRFSVSGKRNDGAYFDQVRSKLAGWDQVVSLQANPLTGSVLVVHRTTAHAVSRFAEENGLFTLAREEHQVAEPITVPIAIAGRNLSDKLQALTGGSLDLTGLAFLGLVAMGVLRVARGAVWPAGFTLLWYASTLAAKGAPRAGANGPPSID